MPAAFSSLKYPKLVKQDFYQIMISQQVLNKKKLQQINSQSRKQQQKKQQLHHKTCQNHPVPSAISYSRRLFFNIDILRSFFVSSLLTFSFRTLLQETLHLRRWSSLPWIHGPINHLPLPTWRIIPGMVSVVNLLMVIVFLP